MDAMSRSIERATNARRRATEPIVGADSTLLRQIRQDTVSPHFSPNSLKTKDRHPNQAGHFFKVSLNFYSTMPPNKNVRNSQKTNNRCTLYSTINQGGGEADYAHEATSFARIFQRALRRTGCHTMLSSFTRKSLKTNDPYPRRVTHNFERFVSEFTESHRVARSSDSLSGGTTTCD